jgi:dienelactone hydrolase
VPSASTGCWISDICASRYRTRSGDDVLEDFSPVCSLPVDGRDVPPLLLARAGLDRPVFNEAMDRFAAEAIHRGAAVDLLTHPRGQHGFDVLDDDDRSREIIARTLAFMRWHLSR